MGEPDRKRLWHEGMGTAADPGCHDNKVSYEVVGSGLLYFGNVRRGPFLLLRLIYAEPHTHTDTYLRCSNSHFLIHTHTHTFEMPIHIHTWTHKTERVHFKTIRQLNIQSGLGVQYLATELRVSSASKLDGCVCVCVRVCGGGYVYMYGWVQNEDRGWHTRGFHPGGLAFSPVNHQIELEWHNMYS